MGPRASGPVKVVGWLLTSNSDSDAPSVNGSRVDVASSDIGGLGPSPPADSNVVAAVLIASITSSSEIAPVYPDSGEIPSGSPNSGGISDITGGSPSGVIVGGSPIGPSPVG